MDNALSLRTFQDYLNYSDQLFEEVDRLEKERIRFETVALYKEMSNFIHNNIVDLDYDCELYTEKKSLSSFLEDDSNPNKKASRKPTTIIEKLQGVITKIWHIVEKLYSRIMNGIARLFKQQVEKQDKTLELINQLNEKIDNIAKDPQKIEKVKNAVTKAGLKIDFSGLWKRGKEFFTKNLPWILSIISIAGLVIAAIMNPVVALGIGGAAASGVVSGGTALWGGVSAAATTAWGFLQANAVVTGITVTSGALLGGILKNRSKLIEMGRQWRLKSLAKKQDKLVTEIDSKMAIFDQYVGFLSCLVNISAKAIINVDYRLSSILKDLEALSGINNTEAKNRLASKFTEIIKKYDMNVTEGNKTKEYSNIVKLKEIFEQMNFNVFLSELIKDSKGLENKLKNYCEAVLKCDEKLDEGIGKNQKDGKIDFEKLQNGLNHFINFKATDTTIDTGSVNNQKSSKILQYIKIIERDPNIQNKINLVVGLIDNAKDLYTSQSDDATNIAGSRLKEYFKTQGEAAMTIETYMSKTISEAQGYKGKLLEPLKEIMSQQNKIVNKIHPEVAEKE